MKISKQSFMACLLMASIGSTLAAETLVLPGNNTLLNAVNSAEPGDVLVLKTGTYQGGFVATKSLTVRAEDRTATPVITGSVSVNGFDADVTLQGLTFSNTTPSVAAARSLRILENTFSGSSLSFGFSGSGTDAIGDVFVVGNSFGGSNGINACKGLLYAAANEFNGGGIFVFTSAWVIGNSIRGTGFGLNTGLIDIRTSGCAGSSSTPGTVRILGNRITCVAAPAHCVGIVLNNAASAHVAGNVVVVEQSPFGHVRQAATLLALTGVVANNSFVSVDTAGGYDGTTGATTSTMSMLNNISVGFASSGLSTSGTGSAANNLCFDTSCPAGQLTDDPQFVDDTYRLAPGSPAIDAGTPDPVFADLDRTRNDIGAFGGPWGIAQFDAQRDPLNSGPYVFPLFESNFGAAGGTLEVRALGVARLK